MAPDCLLPAKDNHEALRETAEQSLPERPAPPSAVRHRPRHTCQVPVFPPRAVALPYARVETNRDRHSNETVYNVSSLPHRRVRRLAHIRPWHLLRLGTQLSDNDKITRRARGDLMSIGRPDRTFELGERAEPIAFGEILREDLDAVAEEKADRNRRL